MKANDGFTLNPNVIWMLPPKPVEEDVSESLPCKTPTLVLKAANWSVFGEKTGFL